MDNRTKNDLDRHITGNYGEDQEESSDDACMTAECSAGHHDRCRDAEGNCCDCNCHLKLTPVPAPKTIGGLTKDQWRDVAIIANLASTEIAESKYARVVNHDFRLIENVAWHNDRALTPEEERDL